MTRNLQFLHVNINMNHNTPPSQNKRIYMPVPSKRWRQSSASARERTGEKRQERHTCQFDPFEDRLRTSAVPFSRCPSHPSLSSSSAHQTKASNPFIKHDDEAGRSEDKRGKVGGYWAQHRGENATLTTPLLETGRAHALTMVCALRPLRHRPLSSLNLFSLFPDDAHDDVALYRFFD